MLVIGRRLYRKVLRCTIPEGVEVTLSADLIRPLVVGKKIVTIASASSGRYGDSDPEGLLDFLDAVDENFTVVSVKNRGKFMYWSFDKGWYMFCTFGMTGQWTTVQGKHPCLVVFLEDSEIYFNDPRHFGTIKFTNNKQDLLDKLDELGWDPLFHGTTNLWINDITNTISKSKKPIGQLLMDQKIFAGVGNYIRAEALYLAKLSPWRLGKSLSVNEIKTLCDAIVQVMKESYQHQGATISTYKTVYGAEGQYSSCFKVYDQPVDPLGNKIIKETTPEGRTIHWCPTVQL